MRLPDFLLIGTMKSGTTTAFRWLEAQPEIWVPAVKEPNYFVDDDRWGDLAWYGRLFAPAPSGALTGEASVRYTSADLAAIASERIAATLPDVRLICLLRHPVERLRSHYRHEVQRSRERASFDDAVSEGSPYFRDSLYHRCLQPHLDRFPGQLVILRFEDLVGEGGPAWSRLVAHLGLADRPPPGTAFNVSEGKAQFSGAMRFAWERGLHTWAERAPAPVRRAGRRLAFRRTAAFEEQRTASREEEVAPALEAALWTDIERLEAVLGCDQPLWER